MSKQIEIYQTKDNQTEVKVLFEKDTVWLNRHQIAKLFDRDIKTIGKHINNVYKEKELEKASTVAKFATVQKEGGRAVKRDIAFYNLDVIISIGYRVKSKQGTQFRIWATQRLKDYLVKGYAINQRRLEEKTEQLHSLKKVIHLQEKLFASQQLNNTQTKSIAKIISTYAFALDTLDDYDYQRLTIPAQTTKEIYKIEYQQARKAIDELGNLTQFEGLFGREKDESFKSSLQSIYQTFDGKDLYPSLIEKAAHLLYFVVKNHSFTDGNKRIAAFLFVWFLEKNNILYKQESTKRISDNTLIALTLLIAESNPNDKDMMIKVIATLLNSG